VDASLVRSGFSGSKKTGISALAMTQLGYLRQNPSTIECLRLQGGTATRVMQGVSH